MKVLKGLLLLALIGAAWSVSLKVKEYRLNQLEAKGQIPYGPIPDFVHDYYSYNSLNNAFDSKLDLRRSEEFSKAEFQSLILNSLDSASREKFNKYIIPTLSFSEDYQIDPFWIISVMMVESGFDLSATSNKNARGLMQVRPKTAGHIYQLMNKKISEEAITKNLHKPKKNIEVGVFYLKKLLQNFRLNYSLATVAYNVGPNKLRTLISADEIDVPHFTYLVKVRKCYKLISKYFLYELKIRPAAFESTYVVRNQGNRFEENLLGLYVSMPEFINSDLLLSSENPKKELSHSLTF